MKKDYCVICGSENLKKANKELELNLCNPGTIKVVQKGTQCQECGDTFFNREEMDELSEKIKAEKKKIEAKL